MKLLLVATAFAVSVLAAPPIVIRNATVLTITKGTLANGSILIRDGKIAEVGDRVNVPANAKVVDASGRFVMPGIIDCHSHIAADSINEGSVSVSAMVGIEDVLNPDDIAIYRALAGGVTTANVLHGSANAIGGKCTVIKMRWGKDAHDMIFQGALPGIKFALGENPKRAGNPTGQRVGAGNVPLFPQAVPIGPGRISGGIDAAGDHDRLPRRNAGLPDQFQDPV